MVSKQCTPSSSGANLGSVNGIILRCRPCCCFCCCACLPPGSAAAAELLQVSSSALGFPSLEKLHPSFRIVCKDIIVRRCHLEQQNLRPWSDSWLIWSKETSRIGYLRGSGKGEQKRESRQEGWWELGGSLVRVATCMAQIAFVRSNMLWLHTMKLCLSQDSLPLLISFSFPSLLI